MLVIPNAPCVFLESFIHSTASQLKSRGCTLSTSHRLAFQTADRLAHGEPDAGPVWNRGSDPFGAPVCWSGLPPSAGLVP